MNLLKEKKSDKINIEIDYPEKYSIINNLWKFWVT